MKSPVTNYLKFEN